MQKTLPILTFILGVAIAVGSVFAFARGDGEEMGLLKGRVSAVEDDVKDTKTAILRLEEKVDQLPQRVWDIMNP